MQRTIDRACKCWKTRMNWRARKCIINTTILTAIWILACLLGVGRRPGLCFSPQLRGEARTYKNIPRIYSLRAAHNVICLIAIHKGITTPIKALGRFLRGTLNDRSSSLRSANGVPSVNLALNVCWPCLNRGWYLSVRYILFARDRQNRYLCGKSDQI